MIPQVKAKIKRIQLRSIPEGYKKTKVGVIPDMWRCYQIHECLSICNHERKPISEDVRKTIPGPYPYYGPTQAQGYIATYESKGPAVLIGEDGDHFLKYKDREMTMYVDGKYTVNNHAHVLRGTELCETEWFYYAYQHKSLFDAITRQGAGRYKLTKEALIKLPLQCPPIEEQRKIISILTTQDKVIDLKEKLLGEKQRQKKYLMQQLLTGKKRLPGFYGAWSFPKAKEIFQSVSDKDHKGDLAVLSSTQDRGIVPRDEVDIDIKYDACSLVNYKKVSKGNFVISLRSFQGGIEYSTYTGLVSPAYTVLSSRKEISDGYYKQFFKSTDYINRLNVAVYGIRDGKQISYEDFGRLRIPYPPIKEQDAIAEVLSTADHEIDLLQQDIEQEKQKKKALMQLLLTGIVRVKT